MTWHDIPPPLQVRDDLFYSLAIPVPCLIVAIIYIVVAYFYIYSDPAQDKPALLYRPVATLSTASAMAALIDTATAGGMAAGAKMDDDDERRKRLLLQVRKLSLPSVQSAVKCLEVEGACFNPGSEE